MTITLTAFKWVPPFAQGYVKDLRLRWALEEAGFPYDVTLIDPDIQASCDYRRWQPFGQVPAYRDDDVEMFESGAIVLHLASRSEVLAPRDAAGRARVSTWVFAALNSIEPFAQALIHIGDVEPDDPRASDRRQRAEAALSGRLAVLSTWLEGKDYLEGRFTAGDLMMTMVLRELGGTNALEPYPALAAYLERCLARRAFGRALAAQLETFREHGPA